jgi:hypothetical protein
VDLDFPPFRGRYTFWVLVVVDGYVHPSAFNSRTNNGRTAGAMASIFTPDRRVHFLAVREFTHVPAVIPAFCTIHLV